MKVVINDDFGGFGLSHVGIMLYAKLAGLKLYPYTHKRLHGNLDLNHIIPVINVEQAEREFYVGYSKTPIVKETPSAEAQDGFYARDLDRSDPILIQVVEQLGEKANGKYSSLKIVEIPDGVEYEIDEYDGSESIHEKHRSWR